MRFGLVTIVVLATGLAVCFAAQAPEMPRDRLAPHSLQAACRQVAERVIPAVVGIGKNGTDGSGVIISKDGLILTQAHVAHSQGEWFDPKHLKLERKTWVVRHDGTECEAVLLEEPIASVVCCPS